MKIIFHYVMMFCCYILAVNFLMTLLDTPLGWISLLYLAVTAFFFLVGFYFFWKAFESLQQISYNQLNKFLEDNNLHEESFTMVSEKTSDGNPGKLVCIVFNSQKYLAEARHYFRITSIHEGYLFFINETEVEKMILVVYDGKKQTWTSYSN